MMDFVNPNAVAADRSDADAGNPARAVAWRRHSIAVAVFALASLGAVTAQDPGHPVTSAIIYLVGVTLVAGLHGLHGALVAAAIASLIYNFFISEPALRFSLASPEDYVPIMAFAGAAVVSGYIAGRLKDRALAAEAANMRLGALFDASRLLQKAVGLEDVRAAAAGFFGGKADPELYLAFEDGPRPVGVPGRHLALAAELLDSGREVADGPTARAFALGSSSRPAGILVIETDNPCSQEPAVTDASAFSGLLGIALERCLLLEAVAEAELLRRSEELKTTLLSSVSHDLRTPLSAISASASSLASLGDQLPAATRSDLLQMICEQCARLDRYTANLLNLARLQHGLDAAAFIDCEILEVLGTAVARARNLGTGHRLEKDYSVSSAIVRADPVMLEQVFFNVIQNSFHYTPADARVRVSVLAVAEDISIRVCDDGPGIAPHERERVFDRFYRGGGGAAREGGTRHGGSGLGLSIAKGFTEAFGGRIEAGDGDNGKGSCIRIDLPARDILPA